MLILAELAASNAEEQRGAEKSLSAYLRLRPALDYIGQHFQERLYEKELAAMIYVSESRFRHVFREQMRMSFQEYVQKLRYLEARRLIASTDMDVGAAVRQAGFANANVFYRLFREAEGLTPLEWRAQQGK